MARILETVNGSKGIFLARIREREFIMITEQGLKLELRKKFIGMEFKEIYKLEVRILDIKLLKEEVDKRIPNFKTYYQESTCRCVEFVPGVPVVYDLICSHLNIF